MKHTYRSFEQLNGNTLKEEDTVYFGKIKYTVYANYLDHADEPNDYIFKKLGIERLDYTVLARDIFAPLTVEYGSVWPAPYCSGFPKHDYLEALTRLVLTVYSLLDSDTENARFLTFQEDKATIDLQRYHKLIAQRTLLKTIRLSDSYHANLRPDYMEVGCQKISYETLAEVYREAKKLNLINQSK